MLQRLVALAVLLALAAAGAFYLVRRPPVEPPTWQGYAEADFVKVGPTQQGLVTRVLVSRGDHVAKGAPLFEQDSTADRAAFDQAQFALQQAEEQLADLEAPARETEILQAEANLRDLEAARDKIASDLQRNQALLDKGAATAQLVAEEQDDLRSAEAKIAALKAQIEQLKESTGRQAQIEAQSNAVEAAKAALEQARWRLDQRSVASPVTGVVADVLAEAGETLAAGAPVVSLLPPENIYVRFFVPEPSLSGLKIGDTVGLACELCPPDYVGVVSYISPQAEYTPPFIYSETTRAKFVFLAEARPSPSIAAKLNPGQPVTVRFGAGP